MKSRIKNETTAALAAAVLTAAGLALGISQAQPAQASTTCGVWRWPVKTGSDATRYQVHSGTTATSIGYLAGRTPPSSFGSYAQNHRIKWPEFRFWQLNGVTLVAVKLEADGDYHLRLRNHRGKTMIGEVPKPSCVSSASLWKTGIKSARAAIYTRYAVSESSWTYVYRTADIRGIGFFDEDHGVTGAAPNDIELHPVTHIRFR